MELQKILKRFTKQQLSNEVWEILKTPDNTKPNPSKSRKEELISHITKVAKKASYDIKKLSILLEIKSCQLHLMKGQWSAFEIENQRFFVEETTDAENFAKKLSKFLNKSQLFCEVVSEFFNDMLWTAVTVQQRQSHSTFFLLSNIQLPIVLYCRVKVTHQEILKRSLVQLFGGTECKTLSMKSKHVDTLLLFAFKKSKLSDKIEVNTRLKKSKRKRTENDPPKLPSNIINEDEDDDEKRKDYLENTFCQFEQPVLECLTYNVSTNFFGFDDNDKPLSAKCRVGFKGQNVLKGIQELVEIGTADFPLPDYLTDVTKYGTNYFNIKLHAKGGDLNESLVQLSTPMKT